MKRGICAAAFTVVLCAFAVADGLSSSQDETVAIPLDEIWAYEMPGTRDIQELDRDLSAENPETDTSTESGSQRDSLWTSIANSLSADMPGSDWPREGQLARPGFAVVGTGREALRRTHAVLVNGEKPAESFELDTEISLAFFSYQTATYVHIQKVERRGNEIEIQYRFVGYGEKFVTAHLALIPLGKLLPGEYEVNMVQLPSRYQSLVDPSKSLPKSDHNLSREKELGRRFVSQPFSFSVWQNRAAQ
jgi:hypothetical protein